MRKCISALLVAAAALSAASAAKAQDRNSCLRLGQVDGFSAIQGNDRAFIVTDKLHRKFKITLMNRCPGVQFNLGVGFRTLERGPLACISRGDTVIARDPTMAGGRCPIRGIEPYTPAMEAADRAAARDRAKR